MSSAPIWRRFLRVVNETLVATFVFTVLIAGLTWPAVANLKTHFISDGGDLYLFAMHRVHEAWGLGEYPFGFTTELRFPVGYNFGVGIDAVGGVLLGAWLLDVTSDPVMSYNLALLCILVINMVAFYWFSCVMSKSRLVGVVGAVMGGYSWYVVARAAGHLNLVLVAGWPVVALGAWWLTHRRPRLGVSLLYLGTTLLLWGSLQYLIMLSIVAVIFLAIFALLYPKPTQQWLLQNIKLWWLHLLLLPILLSALLWPFWPTIQALAAGTFEAEGRDVALRAFESSWQDLFIPSKSYTPTLVSKLGLITIIPNIETTTFVGWAELFFVVLFFFSRVIKKRKALAAGLLTFFTILTLGITEFGIPLPFAFLSTIFPFSGIAEPSRFAVILTGLLAVCCVLWLSSFKRRAVRVAVATLVLIVLLLERVPQGFYQALAPSKEVFAAVSAQPGKAVFDIPLNLYRQDYSFMPIFTPKSIVNGYIHWSTNTNASRAFIDDPSLQLGRFHCDENDPAFSKLNDLGFVAQEKQLNATMLQQLKAAGVTQIVVHTNADFFHKHCANVRARLSLLLPSESVVKEATSTKPYLKTITNGQMNSTLYVATDGVLGLHAVSLTGSHATVSASLQGRTIHFPSSIVSRSDQEWLLRTEDETGKAYADFTYAVKAGDRFTITSPNTSELGGITVWYDFQPNQDSSLVLEPTHPLKLIFDDGVHQVYYLQ